MVSASHLIVSSPDPGLYLLTNGQEMYLWVGRGLAANFIEDVFGVMVYEAIPEDMVRVPVSLEPALTHVQTKLPALETTMSKKVRNIVTGLRNAHHRYMILRIIKEDSKHRHLVTRYLVRLAATYVLLTVDHSSTTEPTTLCHIWSSFTMFIQRSRIKH